MNSTIAEPDATTDLPATGGADLRERLFNDGAIGPIEQVQLPLARITSLLGVMFDVDPSLIHAGQLVPQVPTDPPEFYSQVVNPWIDRHATLAKAEVRDTGSGVHVILRLAPPVPLQTDADRQRWASVVEVVQSALPCDPRAPGITATTRALGSVNSKNGRTVSLLKAGDEISGDELERLAEELIEQPFKLLLHTLTGCELITPCLKCKVEGSSLEAGNYVGFCYGGCKKVNYADLVAEVLR